MKDIFDDISKYYAANIVGNILTIGKIVYRDNGYHFIRDDVRGPFNLVDPGVDVTRIVHGWRLGRKKCPLTQGEKMKRR